jgi:hypothetical protein
MNRNIGSIDRVVRVLIGLAALSLMFVGPKTLWGLLGLVPLLTAMVGWCPPYAVFGISTCKSSPKV